LCDHIEPFEEGFVWRFPEWFGLSQAMKPVQDDFDQAIGEKDLVLKVDVDRNPAALQADGV